MRADTKGKDKMGRRFAVVICVAATGVMALGAQTAAAAPGVVEYGTKLGITRERPWHGRTLWHGELRSNRQGCKVGREVILFRKRPGPDRKLGASRPRSVQSGIWAWSVKAPMRGRVYAKAMPKAGDGFVCRADRSRTIVNGRIWE